MATAGYLGTPLAKKLGLKEGMTIDLVNQPVDYFELIEMLPAVFNKPGKGKAADFVHLFLHGEKDLSLMKKYAEK